MHRNTAADGGIYMGAMFFTLLSIMFNGFAELHMTVERLPAFYKQRDDLFYPAWVYTLPQWMIRIPMTFVEVSIWMFITYYPIGYDPSFARWSTEKQKHIPIRFLCIGLYMKSNYEILLTCCNRFFKQFLVLACISQMANGLFRLIGVVGRNITAANTFGFVAFLVILGLSGFVLPRGWSLIL